MQAIMMSIRPQWVAKILDGIKKDEIRTLTKPRNINPCVLANGYFVRVLTRAPQSWCYIEMEV